MVELGGFFCEKNSNLLGRLRALPKEGDNSPSFGRARRRLSTTSLVLIYSCFQSSHSSIE